MAFALDQASGASTLSAISDAFALWADASSLERCGLVVSSLVSDKTWRTCAVGDAQTLAQDDIAAKLGSLQVALAKSCLWNLSDGWAFPRRFCELANPETERACLMDFRAFREAFEQAKLQTLPLWRNLCKSSIMLLTLVQDYGKRCANVNWANVPDDVKEHAKRLAMCFPSTSVACQVWEFPSATKLLSEKYGYREIDAATYTAEEDVKVGPIPKTAFLPRSRRCSTPRLKEISRRRTWPSMWPPENYHGVVEEMLFMRWCFERNCFDQALYVSMPSWGPLPARPTPKKETQHRWVCGAPSCLTSSGCVALVGRTRPATCNGKGDRRHHSCTTCM